MRAQNGVPFAAGLTLPSRGRPTSGFASCRPPLMSNVRPHQMLREQGRNAAQQSQLRPSALRRPVNHSVPACEAAFRCRPGLSVPRRPSDCRRSAEEQFRAGSSQPNVRFSAAGQVRYASQVVNVERATSIMRTTNGKVAAASVFAASCFIVGPAGYRSAWAAGPVRRQLSLAPRSVVPRGCQRSAVLLHNAA